MSRPPLLAIVGPTATGKSDLALALARKIHGEILSADSMQIYRYMDIGTAKPPKKIREAIPHNFIDILDPDETYSAGEFARQAHRLIREKTRQGIPLILVGGTGLYIKALEKGLVTLPPISREVEATLWETYVNEGLPPLYERLRQVDPVTASIVHPHDRFRILRALGIFETTGTPLSLLQTRHGFRKIAISLWKVGLIYPREFLYKRIETRVDDMIKNGWIEEVETLLEKGYRETLKPMQAIGYKQLVRLIQGKMTRKEAVEEIKKETRHLAKRQITWFRKEPPKFWMTLKGNQVDEMAENLLTLCMEGKETWKPEKV